LYERYHFFGPPCRARPKQEAFEKCWAHSPLRAAACRITIHQVSLLSHRTPPAHRCLKRRRRQQRQRVTEGTAIAPWNGPNNPQTCCQSQSNRWDLKCRANARGESVAVRRAAGRLFQMCGPATAKLLVPSVVVVLGTNSASVCCEQTDRQTHTHTHTHTGTTRVGRCSIKS